MFVIDKMKCIHIIRRNESLAQYEHCYWPFPIYCVKVDDLLTANDSEKAVGVGGGGEPEVNNLVCTKRQKDMYANRKHETTLFESFTCLK